jgi:hypothetical protein
MQRERERKKEREKKEARKRVRVHDPVGQTQSEVRCWSGLWL